MNPTALYYLLICFSLVGTQGFALYSEQKTEQLLNNSQWQKEKDQKEKKDKTLTATLEPTKTPKKTDTIGPTITATPSPTATKVS